MSIDTVYSTTFLISIIGNLSMQKMLFVTTIEFRKPFNGGTVYSNSLYSALAHSYDVDVVILRDQRFFLSEIAHKLMVLLAGLFSVVPLNAIYHSGITKRNAIDVSKYQHIVVDHLESCSWVGLIGREFILVAHNIESHLSEDKLNSRYIRWLYNVKSRLERYENNIFKAASAVICISSLERDIIRQCNSRVIQVLPSFGHAAIDTIESEIPRFGFIGPESWAPNKRTVNRLISKCFPKVVRHFEFVLAGAGWESLRISSSQKFRNLGFIDEVDDFWRNIDVLLAPTQQGAGVNIKICEAIYHGIIVITNTRSACAIFGTEKFPPNIIIADNDARLIEVMESIELIPEKVGCVRFTQTNLITNLTDFVNGAV
jgi:hypothetical protein